MMVVKYRKGQNVWGFAKYCWAPNIIFFINRMLGVIFVFFAGGQGNIHKPQNVLLHYVVVIIV